MRYAVTALVVVALAATPVGAETLRQKSQRSVDLGSATTVVVQNARGRIEVTPSADRSLHVTALKIVRGSSTSTVQKLADETTVELQRDGPRYGIRVKYPQGTSVRVNIWEGFNEYTVPRVEVHLMVEVPAGIAVELEA